ncbi:glycosyltransferase family 1 protein [Chromobacterium sp. Rain0013]|nr:glycosyltransferase family 1 protein [Chromobacterium sp. Rain0013]QOZ82758.1 glycosyltransferase family 1 protein [Chromobacterium sp. Rain0013]
MKKIGIDARFVTRAPRRGIGNYSIHLLNEMIDLASDYIFYLYISQEDSDAILPTSSNVIVRQLSMPGYPLWEQIALPRAIVADQVDLLHCLGNTGPIFRSGSVKCRQVLSLHDVMFLEAGQYIPRPTNSYQALGRLYRKFIAPRYAKQCDKIITVSNYSKLDILKWIPELEASQIVVTEQSCDPIFKVFVSELTSRPRPSGRPYIFALGAEDPRKNTMRLVQAYLSLLREDDSNDLVICGYQNWESGPEWRAVQAAGAQSRVHFLSFVPKGELIELYRNASFFIYPSLYEGFGIPLLEAFSVGCPVITSNVTSMPEVAGDAALYVDPYDIISMSRAMLTLLKDVELREAYRCAGERRADMFSWSHTAEKTLAVYEKCFKEKAG